MSGPPKRSPASPRYLSSSALAGVVTSALALVAAVVAAIPVPTDPVQPQS
jgi:hypothetical protein